MKKSAYAVKVLLKTFLIWAFLYWDIQSVYPNTFVQPDAGTVVSLITLIQRICALFGDFSIVKEAAFIVIGIIVYKAAGAEKSLDPIYGITVSVMSVIYIFAESYRYTDSACYIFGDPFMFLMSLIRAAGLFMILSYLAGLLLRLYDGTLKTDEDRKYSYLKLLLIIGLCWLPCLIAMYPGGYSLDSQIQLRQFFGYEVLSNAQPTFNTFLIGICVSMGNLIGNSTFGLFLFTLIQFSYLLVTVTYGVWFVVNRIKNTVFTRFFVFFAATSSMFVFYSASIGRDATYSSGLLLIAVSAWRIIELVNEKDFKRCIYPALNFSLFSLISCLLRNNGIYVVIPTAVALAVYLIIKITPKKTAFLISFYSILGILFFYITVDGIYPALGVKKNSDTLVYIVMVQNVSKCIVERPGDFSDEEMDTIGKVVDLTMVNERYNPKTSDGIKPFIYFDASDDEWKAFEKIWFKKMLKHPLLLAESSFNISYGFWAPVDENTSNDFGAWYYESEWPELNFKVPEKLTGIRYLYEILLSLWLKLPVIRLLQVPGLYTWLFALSCIYLIRRKSKEVLIMCVPGMVTVMFFLVLPSFYGHPRYCFPIIYSLVVYAGLCLSKDFMKKTGSPAKVNG